MLESASGEQLCHCGVFKAEITCESHVLNAGNLPSSLLGAPQSTINLQSHPHMLLQCCFFMGPHGCYVHKYVCLCISSLAYLLHPDAP